jgi:DNA-binding HxlR family transcriptional regulator
MVTIEYELTKSGETFKQVLDKTVKWGLQQEHKQEQ